MRTTPIVILALAVAVTLPLAARQQEPAAEARLQAAINKETVEGDLKAAIEMYRKLADGATDRAVAVKALLRMGECYEKLGDAESRKAYERVVAQFADQKDAVLEARKRLAANTAGARPETGLIERRVWSAPEEAMDLDVSADGRFISFQDVYSNRVVLHDLVTGEDRTVATSVFCMGAVLSADARQIACGVMGTKGAADGLHLLRTDGTAARTLFSGVGVIADDWSPDGKYLLARIERNDPASGGALDLVLVSVADGSRKTLKSDGGVNSYDTTPRFSPDGRYIVYPAFRNGPGGKAIPHTNRRGTLRLMPRDGSSEVALVEGAPSELDWSAVWTPDGRHIVFLSDRSGATALWTVRVVDGKPQGDPERLKAEAGERDLIGFSGDGTLYSMRSIAERDIFVADVEPATGQVLSAPKRVNQAYIGSSGGPLAWSPDGKWMVYTRFQDSKRTLVVHSMETGEDRELPEPTSWVTGWFPDGQSLLAGKTRIDVRTGRSEPIAGLERVVSAFPGTYVGLSHDGKTFYYSVNDNDAAKNNGLYTVHLIRRRVDTGEEKDLYQGKSVMPNGLHCITVSPDDRQVAFAETIHETVVVKVIAAEGGVAREVFAKSAWGVVWSKDGKYLLLRSAGKGGIQLLSVPVDGGPARPIALPLTEVRLALHPDGRRLAFTTGSYASEVTGITNLFGAR